MTLEPNGNCSLDAETVRRTVVERLRPQFASRPRAPNAATPHSSPRAGFAYQRRNFGR